jgi:hypothetical protein
MIDTNLEPNYYDTFINSLLSLPPKVRSFVLNIGSMHAKDNNPYLYLWETYCNEEEESDFLHKLLDEHQLALD